VGLLNDNSLNSQFDWSEILWKNQVLAQKIVHSLLGGRHIDLFVSDEFRFLEDHSTAWEEFFKWLGYCLKRSELGGSPFFYLEPKTDLASQTRLSRGATFLGLYLAWHFFMQGPGEPDHIPATELFRKLTSSYEFSFLRTLFIRRTTNPVQMELSEDQAEKLRGYVRKELAELARYRFIDLKPNSRASWEDLLIHRLPALYRFWELAIHVRGSMGADQDIDIGTVVEQVWGSVDSEAEDVEP
jgi:hypothetical protein